MTGPAKRPLRVLYSFAHALDRPGIATTALNEIRGLARRGVEVELYCTSRGRAVLPDSVRVVETMVIAGRRVPHRVLGVQHSYDRHDRIVARRLKTGPRPDIVHVWPRACLATLRMSRALEVPTVRECPNPHTASVYRESAAAAADAGVALPKGHSHAASSRVLELEEQEFATATALVVPSDYAAERFVEEGTPADRVLRHRYGADTDRFKPAGPSEQRGNGLQACFLGRGDPTKGLHIAVRAWRSSTLPAGSVLHIAGAVDPSYAHSMAAELRDPTIRLHGFVSDTPELLRRCDVLLLPTWTEGSALVTYEAQASGCVPLVSTASGAFGIPGSDYLLHEVGDAVTLSAQLSALGADPDELGRRRAHLLRDRERFSWDAGAEALEQCYRVAMQRSSPTV